MKRTRLLVIGYGNELRGDDGIGPQVARCVAGWQRADVRALPLHQLTPEVVLEIANADRVVFIDAGLGQLEEVQVNRIESGAARSALTHVCGPPDLLGLAATLFEARPPAWLITVHALDFGLGNECSSATAAQTEPILKLIDSLASNDPEPVQPGLLMA